MNRDSHVLDNGHEWWVLNAPLNNILILPWNSDLLVKLMTLEHLQEIKELLQVTYKLL